MFFEGLEIVLAGFDLSAEAGGPGGVAVTESAVDGAGGGGWRPIPVAGWQRF